MAYSTKAPSQELVTYKKFWIMTEYILQHNYEDQFVKFLKEIQNHEEFKDMHHEIQLFIAEYEITDEEVFKEMLALA